MKKVLLYVFLFNFLFVFNFVNAEITKPYIVDEKTQIIFGDSVDISGYKGLENYSANYIDGYLHISYSITHGNGSYASYPPILYITLDDPTEVSDVPTLYYGMKMNLNGNPFYPTNVYFVDIQFSQTGYREVVKTGTEKLPFFDEIENVQNIGDNTFIALANSFQNYEIGNPNSMAFKPMRLVSIPPTKVLSINVSTSTNSVTVHDYLRLAGNGDILKFSVTNSGGEFFASNIIATTTGDFYYTWVYPELPKTSTGYDNYIFYTDISSTTVISSKTLNINIDTGIIGYPGYSNEKSETSEQINGFFNYFVQTLGSGLSGNLNRIDVQTKNVSFLYYTTLPVINIFECDSNNYGFPISTSTTCNNISSLTSNTASDLSTSTQSFFINQNNPIVLNPTKYYFFTAYGTNMFSTQPAYFGSTEDVVEGSCYQYESLVSKVFPCLNISDLYFTLYGITKLVSPPQPACTTNCFSNVLFLPGLEASRLYKSKGVTCTFNCEDQLWEPNINSDVVDLYMNPDGTSINPDIYTRDIIKETNTPISMGSLGQNIYKSFSEMMDNLVTDGYIKEWKAFPYDWRLDINNVINKPVNLGDGNTLDLISELKVLSKSSKSGKVTIIAHSNGGLVAKALLVKLQEMKDTGTSDLIDKIDNLILVAVPQIGTASAVPAMLHGFDQEKLGGLLMTTVSARELGRNMSSGYGLLPSKEYVNNVSASPITFVDNLSLNPITSLFIQKYGTVLDSYSEYKNFLLGIEGRTQPNSDDTISPIILSNVLFNNSENLHNKIDNWVPPSSLKVFDIAGWGLDTIASFVYYPKYYCSNQGVGDCSYILDEKPIFTIDGDKTVVEPSALHGVGEKVWIDMKKNNRFRPGPLGVEHKNILEVEELNNYIESIVKNSAFVFDNILTKTKPIDDSSTLRISIHSPVNISAYDLNGNYTGKICPKDSDFCYIKKDIPNSSYLEFGEGKYINLPRENAQKIVLSGTDIGTFTYTSDEVLNDKTSTTTTFIDVPVNSQMTAEIINSSNMQTQELKLDVNSDGNFDITIKPSNKFDPVSFLLIMKETVKNLDIPQVRKNNFINRIDNTIKLIQKNKIDKAKLKVERFESILDRRIDKKEPKKLKPHKLTKDDAEQILQMLDTLLNNLN